MGDCVPVLETERLRLRGHRLEDFAALAAMWADPVTTRHIGGNPAGPEESWTRLLRYTGHWAMLGFGYWVIEEKASGNYVGEAGFAEYKRTLESSVKGMPEIGWVIAPLHHGKGYATEAVRAAVSWGDAHFAGSRSTCLIEPGNVASIRVAEKCGYREWERTVYKGEPAIVFVR
jgi:RimJ/RimL family protein N-acetyltransferase